MKEVRVRLVVSVALDGVPGTYDNVGDFIRLIARSIPEYYLRSVLVDGGCYLQDRMSEDGEKRNMADILAYANNYSEERTPKRE